MKAKTRQPRQKLSAILHADAEKYGLHMERHEPATIKRLEDCKSWFSELVQVYGGGNGRKYTGGDSILATFGSASQCVRFAVEFQRDSRHDEVWNADQTPLRFRIGINLGEFSGPPDELQGHAVNVAARIQELAPPGGILVSDAVRRAAQDIGDLRFTSVGQQKLKHVAEPVELCIVEADGLTGYDQSPLPAPPTLPVEVAWPAGPAVVSKQGEPEPKPPPPASVAVLPLQNQTGDPRDVHLADGIVGDIIGRLTQFRDLVVIAQHSTRRFRDPLMSPQQIGSRLGVRYLAHGGLERNGNRLRARVEMLHADTGACEWSQLFEHDLGDVVELEDVIAARIASEVVEAERRRMQHLHVPQLPAYGLVLRARFLGLRYRKESNWHARRLLEQAADFDPGYGRIYAGLSRTFNLDWRYAWAQAPEAALEKAVELAQTATDHDRHDGRGFAELGFALLYSRRHDESAAAYEAALRLNPNDADILDEMGDMLAYVGEPARGVELVQRAMLLNPYYPDRYLWHLADAYFYLNDYEKTIEALKKMQDQSEAQRLFIASYAYLGRKKEARHHVDELLKKHPGFSLKQWRNVPPVKNPDQRDLLFDGLRRGGLK